MGSKPSVTLTVAGDEKSLTEAFDRVGKASEQMADKVDRASDDMKNAGKGFDDLAEKSDTVDTRAMGFRDTVTGLSDSFKGLTDSSLSMEERLLTLGMGIGDLASGFTNLIIPAMGNMAAFMKGGLASAMSFVAAHPLLIVLGLLAAAFVLLWTNSETFRNIVIGVFQAVGGFIVDKVGGAFRWVVDRGTELVNWFAGLPGMIGRALGSLGNFIGDAFKGGLNVAIDFLNWGIDRINNLIYGVNLINPFSDIPSIPHVPRLHAGGVVPGMPGQEVLTVLQGGETVNVSGQGGGVELRVSGSGALFEAIQAALRDGDLELVGR